MINWNQMIDINEIFSDSDIRLAFWCESVQDTNDLAMMADNIINENIHLISVSPAEVPLIWPYLEKSKVKILTRYVFNPIQRNIDAEIYELAANISLICKKGANGVQMFLKMHDFEQVVNMLFNVRDDLFFKHDLSLGLDISDIDINNLDSFFKKLRDIRADSLVLTLNEDMGNRSDFVGRVYALLQHWNMNGELHFILNNDYDRMDQAIRLIESERPELSEKVRFFLNY